MTATPMDTEPGGGLSASTDDGQNRRSGLDRREGDRRVRDMPVAVQRRTGGQRIGPRRATALDRDVPSDNEI